MTTDFSNDNNVFDSNASQPDAHGQAAMLLIESLIHGLIERKVISISDAVEIVDTAREVKIQTGPELGDSSLTLQKSIWLLDAISASLSRDIPE